MKVIKLFFTILVIATLFFGCGNNTATNFQQPEEAFQHYSHLSQGLINPNDSIIIKFAEPVISSQMISMQQSATALSIKPSVKGNLTVIDNRTIEFEPEKPLKQNSHYRFLFDPSALETGTLSSDIPPIQFEAVTKGLHIVSVQKQLQNIEDQNIYNWHIQLGFSMTPNIDTIRKQLELSVDAKPLDFSISSINKDAILIESETMERDDLSHQLRLLVKASSDTLPEDFLLEETLHPFNVLAVQEVVRRESVSEPVFELQFSDPLSNTQNIAGLIRSEPHVDLDLRKSGNSVLVKGDFKRGQNYHLLVDRGIKDAKNNVTDSIRQLPIQIEDRKPEVTFLQSGVFLPSSGERQIFLKTVNLRRIRVEVKKVFENNLGQFLQTEQLSSTADRRNEFNSSYVNRVGVNVATENLEIGEEKNRELVHRLDLGRLIQSNEKGLFLISVTFQRDDMIWDLEESSRYYYGDEYYSNPNSRGYMYAHGRVYKPVIQSDIGLTWKRAGQEHIIFATNVETAQPLRGVEVTLRTYQNQDIFTGITDSQGKISFPSTDSSVFYIVAEKGISRSVIKASEMGWNLSTFDTGGVEVSEEGTKIFTYTDRGVHRPGDTIHLSTIIRNQDETFPTGHPVSLKVVTPRGQVFSQTTSTDGKDGFYYFPITTATSDPTGTWKAEITAGASKYTASLPVETVVPNRLKINLTSSLFNLTPQDKSIPLSLQSRYLFGAPAGDLDYTIRATISSVPKRFSDFPGYSFVNKSINFQSIDNTISSGRLDNEGVLNMDWRLPSLTDPPSALRYTFEAKVLEEGGRGTSGYLVVDADPYNYYVGIEEPKLDYGYAQIGTKLEVPFVVVDSDGNNRSGRDVRYRVYKNSRYWWWEYDSFSDFRARYKSDESTELVEEGTFRSTGGISKVSFTPEGWGEYFLEVSDSEDGHSAGFFFRASSWADQAVGESAGILSMKADKTRYVPGDRAQVTVVTPPNATLLVSVEKRDEILWTEWRRTREGETVVQIPISDFMLPTAYVSVSLIQPHSQTENDRPVRMYGIVPLNVEDPGTKEELKIEMPDQLSPNEDFTVSVQTTSRQKAQFTVAVVDEGLLDLTLFKTPDPWRRFYQKEKLSINTFDLYAQIIGAFKGDVFKTFSIGGGEDMMLSEMARMAEEEEADSTSKRFTPVAMFSGIMETDNSGKGRVSFKMPNYMGSVRVMVISASGNSYGRSDKTVAVKDEIVLLPTLPRVLGPDESFILPVNVFATERDIKSISINVEAEYPITIEGSAQRTINLGPGADGLARFKLSTETAVGTANVRIKAQSGMFSSTATIPIEIRPSSPPIQKAERKSITPGEQVTFVIPADGIPGTNESTLIIQRREELSLNHRIGWLIRYPYGCIEQTTSSVFPQLHLKQFLRGVGSEREIDKNINAGIKRLRNFQVGSGGFAYWPGGNSPSIWGTNYGGHFLLEAKEAGYVVPDDLWANWIRFQGARANNNTDNLMEQTYRLYLLARAGAPSVGAMNLLQENYLDDLADVEKWLLAGAYWEAGMESTSRRILRRAGLQIREYNEFGGTYGSGLRDRAIILEIATRMENTGIADSMYSRIASAMSSENWYSTQTVGYCLLAAGKYINSFAASEETPVQGTVMLPDGSTIPFSTNDFSFPIPLDEKYAGKRLTLAINESTRDNRVFGVMSWSGVPYISDEQEITQNLAVDLAFFDELGNSMNPETIQQGTEFFAKVTVSKTSGNREKLEEIALTQILPSGWEIINTRLTGEEMPYWVERFQIGNEEYVDYRDDRINWFFDMPAYKRYFDFVVKLQAITEGSFYLPASKAEAMYRSDFYSLLPGRTVTVTERP